MKGLLLGARRPQHDPGAMRYRVQLQRPSGTRDSHGGETRDFETVEEVWAAIDWGTGREFFAAKAVNAEVTHVVVIYTRKELTQSWRVYFNDQNVPHYLDIRSIGYPDDFRRFQILHCRELMGRESQ